MINEEKVLLPAAQAGTMASKKIGKASFAAALKSNSVHKRKW